MARTKQFASGSTSFDHIPRRTRARNQETSDEERDRISNLPECLLSNILSRLPTKDAVRTSVLSKKWEYKWTCIYNLDLNDRLKFNPGRRTRKDCFSFFTDRVLMLGTCSLQSFTLRFSSNYVPSRIYSWISAAMRRNVQNLEIDCWNQSLVLPRSIHGTNSLKELKILSEVTIRLPDETLFSKLTKINFDHVTLSNQNSSIYGRLLLKLPCLETLSMYCCTWKNMRGVTLDAPLLTRFDMTDDCYKNVNRIGSILIEICGSKLSDIMLNGTLGESLVLPQPSPLENARIMMFCPRDWGTVGFRIARTLRQMNALKYLELSGDFLITLNHTAQIGTLPLLVNLSHLKLCTAYYSLSDGVIIRLIQQAPVLQMLTVDMSTVTMNNLPYDGNQGDGAIPACFSSHFKVVKFIYDFDFLEEEKHLGLVRFILKNARVLEQIQFIDPNNRNVTLPSLQIRQLLLSFPRASSISQILFN